MQETLKGKCSQHGGLNVERIYWRSQLRDRMARKSPFAEAGRIRRGDTKFHLELVDLEAPVMEMCNGQIGI